MIYIFTALYHEAQSLIVHYNLKKASEHTRFQVFCNEETGICLTVTGAGEIAAAAAVGSICAWYGVGAGDFLLNLGTCAAVAAAERGQIFLCSKLVEQETGKTFYPDILYRHELPEAELVTGMKVFKGRKAQDMEAESGTGIFTGETVLDAILYDMEGAAVYQAGAYYFAPHRMSFLKVVSDTGDVEKVTSEQVGHLMEEKKEHIISYIELLHRATEEEQLKKSGAAFGIGDGQDEEKDSIMEKLCTDLHCSAVMRSLVQQYFRYCELSGIDIAAVIRGMYEDGRLPCRDKREGKVRFEELKRELL